MNDSVYLLLSAILRSREAAMRASDQLQEDALPPAARDIYDASMELLRSGRPDAESVRSRLKSDGKLTADAEAILDEATSRNVVPMNVETFIDDLNDQYLEEEVKRACENVYVTVNNGDARGEKAVDLLESKAFSVGSAGSGGFRSMDEIMTSATEKVEVALSQDSDVIGVPSGLTDLDDLTSGFQDQKLYVVAARPSAGKSALAGTCMFNAAEKGYSSAGFLLEMSAESFALRGVAKRARVDSFDLTRGNLTPQEEEAFRGAKENAKELPIWMDDTPGLTVEQIYRKLRRLKAEEDVDIAWVDYMQLMEESGVGERRDLEVGHMSRTLKLAAKELDMPIVALSQLSRKVERRSTPRPQLADLRDSGSVEQDADVAIFIYRPEMYGITRDEAGNSLEGVAKLLVEKHRGGPTGEVDTHFSEKYATFTNLAHEFPSE